MHLNGGIVKMSFEGKKLAGNWQMNTILIILGGGGKWPQDFRGYLYHNIQI